MATNSNYVVSTYLHNGLRLSDRKNAIASLLKKIKRCQKCDYDAIACCGYSGMLIAPSIADVLKKPLIIVRKRNDGSHSNMLVEGALDAKTYIIVDDFICDGHTVDYIQRTIKEVTRAELLSIYLWNNYSDVSTRERLVAKHIIKESVNIY